MLDHADRRSPPVCQRRRPFALTADDGKQEYMGQRKDGGQAARRKACQVSPAVILPGRQLAGLYIDIKAVEK